jgi:hypothetical protein
VHARVALEAPDHKIDERLEGPFLSSGTELAVVVARPERMEPGLTRLVAVGRLDDAEEVVEAVVEGEGVTFDVEEEVPGRGRRQARQAAIRFDRPVGEARRLEDLRQRGSRPLALHLEACLLADPGERRPARPLEAW